MACELSLRMIQRIKGKCSVVLSVGLIEINVKI